MKRVYELLALIKDAPEGLEEEVLEALLPVVEKYETWLSLGKPTIKGWEKDWNIILAAYHPRYTNTGMGRVARRLLGKAE